MKIICNLLSYEKYKVKFLTSLFNIGDLDFVSKLSSKAINSES